MKVLLSIKPEFAKKILSGQKKFEFRKNIFKREGITTVVIYATMPVGKVVGEFEIEGVLRDDPDKIWKKTHNKSGIDKIFFNDYYRDRETAVAIKIGKVTEYEKYFNLQEIAENITAPQSYRYL